MPAVTDTTGAEPTYNLADLWEMVVDHDGVAGREALVCGGRRYSYADLEERANRLANHLGSVGVGPGDFVGCYLPNHEAYIDTLLACFKIRAVPVNVNYRYVTDELRHLFDDAGLVAVVCPADYVSRVAAVAGDVPTLRHTLVVGAAAAGVDLGGVPDGVDYDAALAAASTTRPVVPGRGGDDLYVIYTGGTTGLPKGVVLAHRGRLLRLHRWRRPVADVGQRRAARRGARAHRRLRPDLLRAGSDDARRRPVGLADVAAVRRQGHPPCRVVRCPSRSGAPSRPRRSR